VEGLSKRAEVVPPGVPPRRRERGSGIEELLSDGTFFIPEKGAGVCPVRIAGKAGIPGLLNHGRGDVGFAREDLAEGEGMTVTAGLEEGK